MARLFDDASTEYIEVDIAPVTDEPFTMSCWFNSDDATIDGTLMCIAYTGSTSSYWHLRAAGAVAGDPVRAGKFNQYADTTSGFTAGTWHHACGVYVGDAERYSYIDGGSKGSNLGNYVDTTVDRVSIGRSGDSTPSAYYSGSVAEAAIWNVALTDAEVAILAKGYSPLLVRPESLVMYVPLIRDDDEDIVGGLSFTAFNTPSISAHPRVIYPGIHGPNVFEGEEAAAVWFPQPVAYYDGPTIF